MIICAALRLKDELIKNGELIIPCIRHGFGYAIAGKLNNELLLKCKRNGNVTEGFVDHMNKFYDRKEALDYVIEISQISSSTKQYKKEHNENELYSEDLY
jgi:hypothetical protein